MPLHFTAFHPDFKMLDRPPTPPATLSRARQIGMGNGLRYIYTGNVHDEAGGTTHCPACGAAVIGRDWYRLTTWGLSNGRCTACGAAVPGVFEPAPGRWGARRLPVRDRRLIPRCRSLDKGQQNPLKGVLPAQDRCLFCLNCTGKSSG